MTLLASDGERLITNNGIYWIGLMTGFTGDQGMCTGEGEPALPVVIEGEHFPTVRQVAPAAIHNRVFGWSKLTAMDIHVARLTARLERFQGQHSASTIIYLMAFATGSCPVSSRKREFGFNIMVEPVCRDAPVLSRVTLLAARLCQKTIDFAAMGVRVAGNAVRWLNPKGHKFALRRLPLVIDTVAF